MINDLITFTPGSGLDWDSDESALKKGDSRRRLNAEIREGNLAVLVNARGNDVQTKSLPAGTNEIVGWVEDQENNAFIYCVYNSNTDHSIIRYNYDGTFDDISASESFWNFQSGRTVDMAMVGEGDDQQLVLTDGYNPVRKFNVYDIENNVFSTVDKYISNLAKPSIGNLPGTYSISNVRDNPLLRLDSATTVDLDKGNISHQLFQFRVKYIYTTGEESSWSHVYSPDYKFYEHNGNYRSNYNEDVAYEIKFPINSTDKDAISKLKIAFRKGDIGAGTWSIWYLADVIDYDGSTAVYTYYFYNNFNYSELDNSPEGDININYYDVPLTANKCLTASNNRIALFNPQKNYDAVSLNVALEQVRVYDQMNGYDQAGPGINDGNTNTVSVFNHNKDYNLSRIAINPLNNIGEMFEYIHHSALASQSELVDRLVSVINTSTSLNVTAANNSGNLEITNNTGDAIYVRSWARTRNTLPQYTIKSGARHYFALAYYDDENRSTRALIDDDTKIYIEFPTEESTLLNHEYRHFVKYTISHLPPSWATHYQWLYGGSSIERFFQIPISFSYSPKSMDIKYGGDDITYNDTSDYREDGRYSYINLPQAKGRIHFQKEGMNVGDFGVQEGDRVRFIGYHIQPPGGAVNYGTVTLFDELIDVEVIKINENSEVVIPIISQYSSDITSYEFVLAEFYRPKSIIDESNLVYYEVGDVLPISGGYHTAIAPNASGVTSQDQTVSQDAIGVIDFGDVHRFNVEFYYYFTNSDNFVQITEAVIESESLSLITPSRLMTTGRPNIVDPNFKQRTLNAMVWSGTFSEDGIVFNELNKFVANDIRYFEDKFGSVYKAELTGDTITVLQERKLSSIGVGQDEVTNQDGTSSLVAIQRPFGEVRKFRDEAGTIFSRSVVNNGRHVYFYDIYAYKVYRRAYNGLFSVSDYNMSEYFKSKSKALLDSGIANVDVVAGWDGILKMYVITFIDSATPANNETIAFHEPTNRWITFYSFIPDLYTRLGDNVLLTFKDTALYRHHSNTQDRNNFYSTAYSTEIDVISNEAPIQNKRYRIIRINSNDVWSAPDEDSIEIYGDSAEFTGDSQQVYDADMVSSLFENQFSYDRGDYTADFMRDAKTYQSTYKRIDLFRGRPLKGKWLKIRLENSDTAHRELRSALIKSSLR